MNDSSILTTIKKLLGLTEEYTAFDTDIMVHINTVFANLVQMGIGQESGFMITDKSKTWKDFLPVENLIFMNQVISYINIKVRLLFDPPANGNLLEALNKNAAELEYRLYSESLKPVIAAEAAAEDEELV